MSAVRVRSHKRGSGLVHTNTNTDAGAVEAEVDGPGYWRGRAETAEARVRVLEERAAYVRRAVIAASDDDI